MTFKPAHLLLVLLASAAPAMAANIAVVNGKAIPESKAEPFLAQAQQQGQKDSPELRELIKNRLISLEVLSQEAAKAGLDKKDEVKAQLDGIRQQILATALLRDYLAKNPVTDAEVKAEYEKAKAQAADKEYHAYHILVEKEDEAKAIIAKLKAGAKFDELAKQSKDPGSATKGGDLDWAPANAYVPPFAAALTTLQKGQFTETPVKSEFGYHVIKLDDVRAAKIPSLEEVKDRFVNGLQQQKAQKFEEGLVKKAKITQ